MRQTLIFSFPLCLALPTVGVGALTLIQRSRAKLIEQFAVDRQADLHEATRGVVEALDDIGKDLRFAGELLSQPGSQWHEPLEADRFRMRLRHADRGGHVGPDPCELLEDLLGGGPVKTAVAEVARKGIQELPVPRSNHNDTECTTPPDAAFRAPGAGAIAARQLDRGVRRPW